MSQRERVWMLEVEEEEEEEEEEDEASHTLSSEPSTQYTPSNGLNERQLIASGWASITIEGESVFLRVSHLIDERVQETKK
jgi:hypothetical protein